MPALVHRSLAIPASVAVRVVEAVASTRAIKECCFFGARIFVALAHRSLSLIRESYPRCARAPQNQVRDRRGLLLWCVHFPALVHRTCASHTRCARSKNPNATESSLAIKESCCSGARILPALVLRSFTLICARVKNPCATESSTAIKEVCCSGARILPALVHRSLALPAHPSPSELSKRLQARARSKYAAFLVRASSSR